MTIRISLRGAISVLGQGAQPGVALRRATTQAAAERRDDGRLEEADGRYPREGGKHNGSEPDEDGGAETRAATPERAGGHLCGADRAEGTACSTTHCLRPVADQKAEAHAGAHSEHERCAEGHAAADEHRGQKHPDRHAEASANTDPVPTTQRN